MDLSQMKVKERNVLQAQIVAALKKHGGQETKTAKELGVHKNTLRRRLEDFKALGIDLREKAGTPPRSGAHLTNPIICPKCGEKIAKTMTRTDR